MPETVRFGMLPPAAALCLAALAMCIGSRAMLAPEEYCWNNIGLLCDAGKTALFTFFFTKGLLLVGFL